MAQEEKELWAQTTFTITPQDNGMLREISEEAETSGTPDTNLQIDDKNIIQVKTIIASVKQFIDPAELNKVPYVEVECQTYIQNVQKVYIPIELVNEATQTFFIGNDWPIENVFKEVIAVISKRTIPLLKTGKKSQTIVIFDKDYSQDIIIKQLFTNLNNDQIDLEFVSACEEEISEIEAWHSIQHIIDRVFWMSDPEEPVIKTQKTMTQTIIICNSKTGKAICNQETQTGLTCKPKNSNSELLSSYLESKSLAKYCIENCLTEGVYDRIIIDDILDEVLNNCCQEIHLPLLNNGTQTLTSYKLLEDTDEDILKKLRRPVVIDPEESKSVIVSLTEDILQATFTQIAKDAEAVVRNIICVLIKKSVLTTEQLKESRTLIKPKSMDQVFIQRKRKLAQSRRKKPEMENASTQTTLAGVPEVSKLKEPLEVICSICSRKSKCLMCSGSQDNVKLQKEMKILRTQDILLAYRPCYIQTTLTDAKILNLQSFYVPKTVKKLSETCYNNSVSKASSSNSSSECFDRESVEREKSLCRKFSPSGWSDIDLPPSKLWSLQDSIDSKSVCGTFLKKSENGFSKSVSKISAKYTNKNISKSQSDLPQKTEIALKILKSAFCTRETCLGDENLEIVSSTFSERNEKIFERKSKNKIQRQSEELLNGTVPKILLYRNLEID